MDRMIGRRGRKKQLDAQIETWIAAGPPHGVATSASGWRLEQPGNRIAPPRPMIVDDEIKQLLTEIRDDQREILQRQAEHLEVARRQLEQARSLIAESMGLQREGLARARSVGRIAVPGIVVCIAAIVYLVVRYF